MERGKVKRLMYGLMHLTIIYSLHYIVCHLHLFFYSLHIRYFQSALLPTQYAPPRQTRVCSTYILILSSSSYTHTHTHTHTHAHSLANAYVCMRVYMLQLYRTYSMSPPSININTGMISHSLTYTQMCSYVCTFRCLQVLDFACIKPDMKT